MANFANPTVGSAYTSFPTEIRDAIAAALQQLHVGSHSNIPTNAIKWDASDNRWKKYNGSAFVDLTATYAFNAQISATQLSLGDDQKILLGGLNDFELVHDGNNSVIRETGDGSLFLQSNDAINIGNVAGNSQYIAANATNVQLFSGGNEKLKTDGTGVLMPTDSKLRLGNSGELSLVFNGVNGVIQESGSGALVIQGNFVDISTADGTGLKARFEDNGSSRLYYAGSERLTTTNAGLTIGGSITAVGSIATATTLTATTIQLTGELDFHSAGNKFVDFETITSSNYVEFRHFGGSTFEKFLKTTGNGNVELYFNGIKRFETVSDGTYTSGHIRIGDDSAIIIGASSDYYINHSSTFNNTLHYNGTGELFFRTATAIYFQNLAGSETYLQLIENQGYTLYYNGTGQIFGLNGYVQINSNVYLQNNYRLRLGTTNDLDIFHDGANSYVYNAKGILNLQLGPNSSQISFLGESDVMATMAKNSNVVLYNDNIAVAYTDAFGFVVPAITNARLYVGGHVQLTAELDFLGYNPKFIDFETHSASATSYFQLRHTNHSTVFEAAIISYANGATQLCHDGNVKFSVEAHGANQFGQLILPDTNTDEKIILQGTTNPYIRFREGTTNRAYIQFNGGNDNMYFVNEQTGEHFRFGHGLHSFVFHADGIDHNVGRGIVRAGGRFNTSSGTVVSSQTEHVSSITDNNTGDFTFNITAMPDTLYSVVAHMPRAANVLNHVDIFHTQSTTALRFTCSATPNGGNVSVYNQDPINGVTVLIFDM